MRKATRYSAVLLAGVALALFAASVPSFAEVQNVKVGGDITVRGFWRKNMDLNKGDNSGDPNSGTLNRKDNFMMQTTGVNVSADLTENVMAHVRIVNERDWDSSTSGDGNDIDLSQGYIRLKELFYSPLTLTVGTQPIVWGRGFVLGSSLIPGTLARGGDPNSSITANEFTDFTAFDAIRAQLDLGGTADVGMPLNADFVYIKLDENTIGVDDDIYLTGVNLGTRFDSMNSEAEAYYLLKRDTQKESSPATDNKGEVSTWGLRGSAQPGDGSKVWGELAFQHGRRTTDPAGSRTQGQTYSAWAANFGGQMTFADVDMKPGLGLEWIWWSGKDKSSGCDTSVNSTANCGAQSGWDPIARSYFTTAIREFQTQDSVSGFYPVGQGGVTSAATNQHQFAIFTDLDPIEDLHVNSRLTWFVASTPMLTRAQTETTFPTTGSIKRHRFIGTEWDTVLTYNYTDDVQFGTIYALFQPGNVFRVPNDDTAQELITWARVGF
jgi:hypothetical protein